MHPLLWTQRQLHLLSCTFTDGGILTPAVCAMPPLPRCTDSVRGGNGRECGLVEHLRISHHRRIQRGHMSDMIVAEENKLGTVLSVELRVGSDIKTTAT